MSVVLAREVIMDRVSMVKNGTRRLAIFALLLIAGINLLCDSDFVAKALAQEAQGIMVINEDNDHYFKQNSSLMNEKDLQAYIDAMKGSRVTHFFMCPQGQRTSYRSHVHEAIWDEVDGKTSDNIWAKNCKILHEKGIDPYAVWIVRCRENGISPWITMRMNDVHFVTERNYFRNTNFWRTHPELWRVPHATSGNWTDYAFNYAKKEVRDYHLACVRELFERYDFDGFELDWMRFCLHLTPGREREEAHFLTEFVREVRKIADDWEKKRNHPIQLSVRVPAQPEAALALGMDATLWAKEGLVDWIVASCFFSSGDMDIPVEAWKSQLEGTPVLVLVAIDDGISPGSGVPRTPISEEVYNAWATNHFYRGADGLYLFNLVYRPDLFKKLIASGLDYARVVEAPRRHPITHHDYMATPNGIERDMQLPKKLREPADFRVAFGKKPAQGSVFVVVAFRESASREGENFDPNSWEISLNGSTPTALGVVSNATIYGRAQSAIRAEFPLSAALDGENCVRVAPKSNSEATLIWVEMECGF
ncbi:MAG: hypothetical protein Q4D38_04535 [Planctomycetia bacterium]|nr:hypothetical protein [Planctomycetia bacterium]